MNPYFTFLRPFTLVPPAMGMISGSLTALLVQPHPWAQGIPWIVGWIGLGACMAAILNGASNGLNQIFDLEIDRINKPHRPLPGGTMRVSQAWWLVVGLYAIGLTLSALLGSACFLLVAIGACCTAIYSVPPLRTKRHWLAAAITIALPRGFLLPVAGWSVFGEITTPEPWFIGLVFGLYVLGASATKDFSDIEGDRRYHCQTLPVRFGVQRSITLITPFLIAPFLLFPLGAWWQILGGQAKVLGLLGVTLALWGAWIIHLLRNTHEGQPFSENHPAWRQMYAIFLVAQMGLVVAYICARG